MAIEIVDLPIERMVIVHCYVNLPEGNEDVLERPLEPAIQHGNQHCPPTIKVV